VVFSRLSNLRPLRGPEFRERSTLRNGVEGRPGGRAQRRTPRSTEWTSLMNSRIPVLGFRLSSVNVQQISSQSSIFESWKDCTMIRLSTWAMPGAFAAARSADSRCSQVPTMPVNVAVSPDTVTVM
jgi:hypothetical protein